MFVKQSMPDTKEDWLIECAMFYVPANIVIEERKRRQIKKGVCIG